MQISKILPLFTKKIYIDIDIKYRYKRKKQKYVIEKLSIQIFSYC